MRNRFDDGCWVIMLPEPQHGPTSLFEKRVNAAVSIPITSDLLLPPVRVRLGSCAVLWAPMPEAAVQEYDQSSAAPYYVSAEILVWKQPAVDPIAITQRMKSSTNL